MQTKKQININHNKLCLIILKFNELKIQNQKFKIIMMNRFLKPIIVLLFSFTVSIAFGQEQANKYPEHENNTNGIPYKTYDNDPLGVRVYTLSNGLTVYLSSYKDAPRIQTYIAVRAGSKNDPATA